MQRDRVQFVSPFPPLPTGIAQYSRDLVQGLDGAWPLDLVAEAGSGSEVVHGARLRSYQRGVPTIFQIGNSGFHRLAYRYGLREAGILVLHDVMLHHGRSGELMRSRGGADYLRVMRSSYGVDGERAAKQILSGGGIDEIGRFPLCEDYVERARVTIVHSHFARQMVLRHVPAADVRVVPMGIPLPALVDRYVARSAMGLPEHAFVVASITHVNPYKRLPIVLRAMRRVIARQPNAILVIAGNVSPGINLQRQVKRLNLDRNVRLLGYVSDTQARLIARAADVCVNLRFPSAGETSASLLRLLGAACPVLVTDDVSMAEFPREAVIPIPIDRFEDEMVAESLLLLANDARLREEAGKAARTFVSSEHSLSVMANGYRDAIRTAFGIAMPLVPQMALDEDPPEIPEPVVPSTTYTVIDAAVADALVGLRLGEHDATIRSAAAVVSRLGLDALPHTLQERGLRESVAPDS